MEIAETALKDDLCINSEEFEGMYALWKVGADIDALAKSANCPPHILAWYFLMRGAGEGSRIGAWPGPQR